MFKSIIRYWRYMKMKKNITYNDKNQLHSVNNEPALVTTKGTKCWFNNGNLHNTRGPAVIMAGGVVEWWINAQEVTKEVKTWCEKTGRDYTNLTEEDVVFMWFDMGLKYDDRDKPIFSQI